MVSESKSNLQHYGDDIENDELYEQDQFDDINIMGTLIEP